MVLGSDFKDYSVDRPQHRLEPQEILLDRLSRKRKAELSDRRLKTPLAKIVLKLFLGVLLGVLVVLGSKTFYFQVIKHKELTALALQNKAKTLPLRALRGVIYDRKGRQLVFNKDAFDLICDLRDLPEPQSLKERTLNRLTEILDQNPKFLKAKIEQSDLSRVLVKKNLDHQSLISLRTAIDSNQIQGCYIQKNLVREYPNPKILAHILGFTGRITKAQLKQCQNCSVADRVGKMGLEKSYQSYLKGTPGSLKTERNVQGNIVSKQVLSQPEPGQNLVLNLDLDLQKKIHSELNKAFKKSGTSRGVAVALDPENGGVLSLVSLPSFDNNAFSGKILEKQWSQLKSDPDHPLFDRAISGMGYPTGSTIKPLVATAALQEQVTDPETKINCKGLISVDNPYSPEAGPEQYLYHDWKTHGWTDIKKGIAQSCNVYFYTIGGGYGNIDGLGPERIRRYLELFGWGAKTGVDLPQEGKGVLPDLDQQWRLGDTYHLAIGQGAFSVTPLQVATAFTGIANQGIIYRPRVVDKIVDQQGRVVKDNKSEILRKDFADPEYLKVVKQGMEQAVSSNSGTAHLLDSLPVKVAAKTGTAQISKKGFYHKWLTVFAPVEDPEIVLTVIVEEVPENTTVVLPAVRNILREYFQ